MQSSGGSQSQGSNKLSLKEKNRQAQRRFREKQRAKKSEDAGKASELAQQLAELKAQRAAAYSRNLALEKVFELQKLQGNDESQGSGGSSWLSSDHKQANTRSNPIHLSVDVDTLARRLGGQQLSPPMARISTVQLENLEFADFARLWREYISRLAMCLVEANGDDNSPVCRSIHEIMAELTATLCYISARQPQEMLSFLSLRLEDGPPSSGPAVNEEFWHTIAAAANFSDEQQAQMAGIREYFVARMMKIMKERQDISAQLAVATPPVMSRVITMDLSCQGAAGHVRALQATEKLHQNLHQAQDCLCQFQIAARECLTPLQIAMVCVQSFPWMPDIVALFSSAAYAFAAEHSD